jgi:hypothetical protein
MMPEVKSGHFSAQPASPSLSERAMSAIECAGNYRKLFAELPPTDPQSLAVIAVKQWQSDRLRLAHVDLLDSARFGAAAAFFLDDIYGGKDLSRRDQDLRKMLPTLIKLLPKSALQTVVEALEVDALSESLDWDLAKQLCLQTGNQAFAQKYHAAYLSMPLDHRRMDQIALVFRIGNSLDKLVKQPLLGALLNAMEGPAKIAGLSNIYDFLKQGFSAFKKMKGAKEFLLLIHERETAEHERLMATRPQNPTIPSATF